MTGQDEEKAHWWKAQDRERKRPSTQREQTIPHFATRLDLPGDPLDLLRSERPEERALARPVAADEAVPPPVGERERGVFDQVRAAVGEGEVLEVDVPGAAGARVVADDDGLLDFSGAVQREGIAGELIRVHSCEYST